MKFALFAIFVLAVQAAVGDDCTANGNADCDTGAGETCDTGNGNVCAAAAVESGPSVDPSTGMECSMDGYVNLVQ